MSRSRKAVTEPRGAVAARTKRLRTEQPSRVALKTPGAKPNMARPRVEAKESLESAFSKLGGIEGLVTWGKQNPTEFYRLWGRLIPKDVSVSASTSLEDLLAKLAAGAEQPGDSARIINATARDVSALPEHVGSDDD